ncbi:MAG: PTS sugar transporter subunit IIA, partial [Tepidanaerobacteraceae bacterium]
NEDIYEKIEKIREKYIVSAIVGSVDPKSGSIPFISLEELISGSGIEKLREITKVDKTQKTIENNNYNSLIEVFSEKIILMNPNCNTKNDVLDDMVAALIDNGFVKEQFLLDIYKREAMGPAVINKIAIPHGRPENVIKPAIGIAIFKEPIPWWNEIVVDCVFMLALKEDSKDIIRQLYALIKNTEFINKLKCCSNEAEVRSSILEYFLIYN